MLEFQHVSCTAGGRTVTEDITFSLGEGCFTVLLGRNGSGKTTLLRAINREIAYRGGILLRGCATEALTARERARQVAFLPQVLPTVKMSVFDLVALGRLPHLAPFSRMGEGDHAAIQRALTLTEAAPLAERMLSTLSGGERQRAFLAMALAQETPLLLLDEPTTYLDADARHHFLALLRRLVDEEGKTVLTVLHDVNEAIRVADDLLLLHEGRLAFHGDADAFCAEGLPEREFGLTAYPVSNSALPFYY